MMKDNSSSGLPLNTPASLFSGRFRVERQLGSGGFGEVYRGVQESTGTPVAIKMERITGRPSFLFHEARVMQDIQKKTAADGLPAIALLKYFGQEGSYRMLIMELMGLSLEDIHEKRRRFSLKTTLMLGIQMISRLEFLHSAGYIHRDLKPDNFLLGLGDQKNRIYLIDFGLSSRYLSPDGTHREDQAGKSFIGTARYASARTHEGFSQSRRDDIEQLVYVLIYLYRGRLPWSGLQIADRDEKERKIGSMKRNMPFGEICRGCPHLFVLLLNYSRKMRFDEEPAYEMMRGLFRKELTSRNETVDDIFDWDAAAPTPSPTSRTPQTGGPLQTAGTLGKVDTEGNLLFQDSLQLQSDAAGGGVLSSPDSGEMQSME